MFRPVIFLCASLVVIAALTTLAGEKSGPAAVEGPALVPEPKPTPPRRVLITAELSRTHAFPGDSIRLTELVPVDREIKVHSISHTIYTIGKYDFLTESLINLDLEKAQNWIVGMGFGDSRISGTVGPAGDHAMHFGVTNPRQEGTEFDFKARQIGIFLIKAKWKLYHSDVVIESNPVILTVSPPLDKAGKPIIKEEWIDKTAWKYRPK